MVRRVNEVCNTEQKVAFACSFNKKLAGECATNVAQVVFGEVADSGTVKERKKMLKEIIGKLSKKPSKNAKKQ